MSASYLEPFSAESADVPFLTYYGIDSAKAIVVQLRSASMSERSMAPGKKPLD